MLFGEWEAKLIHEYDRLCTSLIIYRYKNDTNMILLCPDGKTIEIGEYQQLPEEAKWGIPRGTEQSIMDTLWDGGVRPKKRRYEEEAKLLREQLEIQSKHLEDMRALVFSLSGRNE